MKEFSTSTTIHASPDAIWTILANTTAYPDWDSGTIKIEGSAALGAKITAYSTLSPNRAFPVKVTTFEPGRKMVWSGGMPLGLFKGERTFLLEPQNDGTTRFSMREVFSGPLLPLIGGTLPDMQPTFDQFAANLKQHAESGGGGFG